MEALKFLIHFVGDIHQPLHASDKYAPSPTADWSGEGRRYQGRFAAACRRARVAALTNARGSGRGTTERLKWLEASIKFKRATPNTLRHTAGTWMAQGGVDLWKIAGWLGHTIERTTELYAHHHPDYLEEGSSALERRMNRESRLQVAINEHPTTDSSGFERPDRAVNAED